MSGATRVFVFGTLKPAPVEPLGGTQRMAGPLAEYTLAHAATYRPR